MKSIGSVSHTCPTEQFSKSKLNYVSGLRTRELIREESPKRDAVKSEPCHSIYQFTYDKISLPLKWLSKGGTVPLGPDLAYKDSC